ICMNRCFRQVFHRPARLKKTSASVNRITLPRAAANGPPATIGLTPASSNNNVGITNGQHQVGAGSGEPHTNGLGSRSTEHAITYIDQSASDFSLANESQLPTLLRDFDSLICF